MGSVVYSSDKAIVHCGMAEDVLPLFGRDSADLLLTDPPYGQAYQSNFRREDFLPIRGDDGTANVVKVLTLCLQALRRGRHLYVFGPDLLTSSDLPISPPVQLVWDKGKQSSMGDLSQPWGRSHEPINFATYVPSKANRADGRGGLNAKLRKGSVLRVQRKNSRAVSRHPTEKPVALMRQLVESSSQLNEVVLDPFAGSGSTLVAAVLAGRRAIGIEVDPDYVDLTIARVKKAERLASDMEAV